MRFTLSIIFGGISMSDFKTYSELIKIKSFEDRLLYLACSGVVGNITFGGHRYLNQMLYKSPEWKCVKRDVLFRDNGCDLAHEDHSILGSIYIHHINPITIEDILDNRPCVFDLDNLVCTSFKTHNLIHYGNIKDIPKDFIERKKNDTCPWR